MQWNEFRFNIRHFSTADQERIQRAFELGARVHANQKRRSGEPYFVHPIAVAVILTGMGADPETIIAGLLHDAVEDTDISSDQIEEQFGSAVASLVDGVTKLNKEHVGNKPTLDEKIETLRKIFTLMQKDVRIMIIKLADRLHNMQTAEFLDESKRIKLANETIEVYVKIAERLCMRRVQNDLEELCFNIIDPTISISLAKERLRDAKLGEALSQEMHERLQEYSKSLSERVAVRAEQKMFSELNSQASAEGSSFNHPDTNLILVCSTVEECYLILGFLHQTWKRETLSFNDFINAPQINGYKGIHTTIILDSGTRVRCKIRTKEMNDYAMNGIATLCFDGKTLGVLEYLPWTQRISQLSEDTEEQSNEFWTSLQSDILGDSIIIHSSGSGIHLLPKGATALDGAYYIYGKKANYMTQVMLNGQNVAFHTPLSYATTVTATFDTKPRVELKWLQYCNTGICTALIRTGLEQQERKAKVAIGKNVLQDELNAKHRGYLEEIDTKSLQTILKSRGYSSMEAIYIQIAEGRLNPREIEEMIFKSKKAPQNKERTYTLQVTIPLHKKQDIIDIMRFYRFKKLRFLQKHDAEQWNATMILSPEEAHTLSVLLDENLNSEFSLRPEGSIRLSFFSSVLLFILWGFDPAVTRLILTKTSASPIDMTIIFFITLTVLTGCFLIWVKATRPLPEARLSLRSGSLWFSGLLLFCVAITTYLAMQLTLPSHYTIPMTAAGLCLTTIVNRRHKLLLLLTWLIVLSGVLVLLLKHPTWDYMGMVFTLLSIIAFTGFSIISERYKRRERISLRAAQYFFLLSTMGLVLTIPLLSYSTFDDLSWQTLTTIIGATVIFSGLPYYIYYYLLSHKEMDFVLRYSFLIIPGTVLSEFLLIGTPSAWTMLAGLLVIVGAFLPIGFLNLQQKNIH